MTAPSFEPKEFSAPFRIDALELAGPIEGTDGSWWGLIYRPTPETAISFALTAYDYDQRGTVHALICAPRFDYTSLVNGPSIHMTMDAIVSRIRMPLASLPKEQAEWPKPILARMAELQNDDEITTLNGSRRKLAELLQDLADFIGEQIDVRCAPDRNGEPYVFTHRLKGLASRTVTAVVHFFHPVAGQAPGGHGWLEERGGRSFGNFYPRPQSGHERMETGARLKAFFEASAQDLKLGPKALANRLKALGLTE